jgi:hypothetical protein
MPNGMNAIAFVIRWIPNQVWNDDSHLLLSALGEHDWSLKTVGRQVAGRCRCSLVSARKRLLQKLIDNPRVGFPCHCLHRLTDEEGEQGLFAAAILL